MATDNPGTASRGDAATSFLRMVVARKIREAYATYVRHDMRHHNPYFTGDAASLQKGMEENHARFPDTTIDIKHVMVDGDFVAVHSHVRMQPSEAGIATVHIFRFEESRIVEMWDIGQAVPAESPNSNGMF